MKIDFEKSDGLVPAVIQDAGTQVVLMLGYMNRDAYERTLQSGKVNFYSRTRKTLWMKGETSGNYLEVVDILTDCDHDTLLIKVHPTGPACHTGQDTCFNEHNTRSSPFLNTLEMIVRDRKEHPKAGSYTNTLFDAGVKKIAQKVGEEATETIIEAMADDKRRLAEETADLLYHLLVLLQNQNLNLKEVEKILQDRHSPGMGKKK